MVEIKLVPVQLVQEVWKELHTPIQSAMRYHGAMDENDLLKLLLLGRLVMFAAIVDDELKGCAIVEQVRFPSRDVCNLVVVAGVNGATRGWIFDMLDELEKWALERGCDAIAGIGRKGWMVAQNHGFKVEQRAILTKDLTHERRRRTNGKSGSLERSTAVPAPTEPGGVGPI